MKFLENGDYIEFASAIQLGMVIQGFFYKNGNHAYVINRDKKSRTHIDQLSFLNNEEREQFTKHGFIYAFSIETAFYTGMPIEKQLKHFRKINSPFYLFQVLKTIKNELI